ncbi:MAG: hypothetical protein ACLU02_04440 [Clostridia bacterium]
MNFDLSWFKTVPGLLITCGVVLLIIALIIFIVTSKNNKNAKKEAQDNNPKGEDTTPKDNVQPVSDGVSSETVAAVNTDAGANTSVETPVQNATPVTENVGIESLQNMQPTQTVNPTPIEVETVSSAPVVEDTPALSSPVVNNTTVDAYQAMANSAAILNDNYVQEPVAPVSQSVEPIEVAPEVTPVVQPEVSAPINPEVISPSVDAIPTPVAPTVSSVSNEQHAIYGGVSQILPNDMSINTGSSNHQIYGGANPLENTQSLPIMGNTQPEMSTAPVSVAPEVAPVVPDIPIVNATPIIPNVSVTPVEENIVIPTPEVSTPVVPSGLEQQNQVPIVPTGIPSVQVTATAPIMPADNQQL